MNSKFLGKRLAVATAIVGALLAGCSKKNQGSGDPGTTPVADGPGGSTGVPQATYEIPLEAVSPDGCLNLALLIDRIKGLPAPATLRRVTTDFSLLSDGKAPRAKLEKVMARYAFFYDQTGSAELAKVLPVAKQDGCSSVEMTDRLGGSVTYQVVESGPDRLLLSQEEGSRIEYQWINSREARVVSSHSTMDFCPDYDKFKAKVTHLWRWGANDLAETPAEAVSSDYLRRVVAAVTDAPASVIDLANTDSIATVATQDLSALAQTRVSRDLQTCPRVSRPPEGDEPPPAEVPETEEPAPEPEEPRQPDPNPVPEPEPAPEAGPA